MTISSPEVSIYEDVAICKFHIGALYSDTLWFRIPVNFLNCISETCDAALVGLLIPAMEAGDEIVIDGPVSERLLQHIKNQGQEILQRVMPWLQHVPVKAKQVHRENERATGVGAAFSGGVDSYAVLSDYYYKQDIAQSFRLTHLFFNNLGSHGKGGERLFNQRFNLVKSAADEIGLPLIKVNSNLQEFYDDKHSYLQTHTLRNLSVPFLLQGGIGRFYYASSASYKDVHLNEAGETSFCEPVLIPLLATDSLDVLSAGAEYTRIEKTLMVSGISHSYRFLNVCTSSDNAENCSRCHKCMRTLLTLDMLGLIDKYDQVFDLETYYQGKNRFIAFVLKRDRVSSREILDYAEETGFRFPASAHIVAKLKRMLGK